MKEPTRTPMWRTVLRGLLVAVLTVVAGVIVWMMLFRPGPVVSGVPAIADGQVVLYEGLPHQGYDRDRLETELHTKPVRELGGYPFYRDSLPLVNGDDERFKSMLQKGTLFEAFSGEKKCGGFHPDYALQWRRGADVYVALICFSCGEAIVLHGERQTRHDLNRTLFAELKAALAGYRENRPQPPLGP